MSRFIQGDSLKIMSTFPDNAIDFILTDPPYLVDFTDRSGRSIANDKNDDWLLPACQQMFRVLKPNSLMISFYGWNRVEKFVDAWKKSGFRVVGHLVFKKNYASKKAFLGYSHESAYLLAKGHPLMPKKPIKDVQAWQYTGNLYHPTQKPVSCLQLLIESFTQPHDIVLDPFAGSGATCIAAALSARRYIGIELLPEYHTIGQQRIAALRNRQVA
ncbi:DNA methyltransferase (plasmid) [Arsenophonus sp. aPb]|uniref:DNA methyltransferase n=1 Tax=Arsenophonus sp. aPb TaxID=3041619 RepID=UPI002468A370|nr:DNA methyltransferase [Arsenophonus sp. aPb]WGL99925.1 DNA methyltransferase [Arsenophonus sp. aPb]